MQHKTRILPYYIFMYLYFFSRDENQALSDDLKRMTEQFKELQKKFRYINISKMLLFYKYISQILYVKETCSYMFYFLTDTGKRFVQQFLLAY